MSGEEKKPFERLPTNVVPQNYKVELTPDLKAFTFKGKLQVTCQVGVLVCCFAVYRTTVCFCLLQVTQPTSKVVLNCAEIEIISASCGNQGNLLVLHALTEGESGQLCGFCVTMACVTLILFPHIPESKVACYGHGCYVTCLCIPFSKRIEFDQTLFCA